jgi:hypothetical protein
MMLVVLVRHPGGGPPAQTRPTARPRPQRSSERDPHAALGLAPINTTERHRTRGSSAAAVLLGIAQRCLLLRTPTTTSAPPMIIAAPPTASTVIHRPLESGSATPIWADVTKPGDPSAFITTIS